MSFEENKPLWRIVSGIELKWKTWGDDQLVYHSGSGDVHLLNPLVVELLRALQIGPLSFVEMKNKFSVQGDKPDQIQGVHLDEIIRQLKKLDLIEPCSS